MVERRSARRTAWAAAVAGLVVVLASCGGGSGDGDDEGPASESGDITFEVEGDVSTAAITYLSVGGDGEQLPGEALPWSVSVPEGSSYTLSADTEGASGSVTCRIRQGDTVLDEQTANTFVSCFG